MRKTMKHKVYSIEEKNTIVKLYLDGQKGLLEIVREYDLCGKSALFRWVKMTREVGTVVDNRGRSVNPGKRKGRPKKLVIEEMSHEELVHYVRMSEDIKKSMAYLRKQKTNTK